MAKYYKHIYGLQRIIDNNKGKFADTIGEDKKY